MNDTNENNNGNNGSSRNNKKPFYGILPLGQWISIGTKKHLGQNFLLDLNITDKISKLANLPENANVMEIGPGLGPLTISLLSNYNEKNGIKKLYVIEMDNRLKEHLEKIKKIDDRLEIAMKDCLKINWSEYGNVEHLVANLPYNISVPFIMNCLQQQNIKTMTVLVQKEVGERFVSAHNKKSYGKISVLAQIFSDVKIVYELGPKAFTPPPKVHSVLLYFQKKNNEKLYLWPTLENMLRLMFTNRRKMLSNTIGKKYSVLFSLLLNKRCENLTPLDILKYGEIIYLNNINETDNDNL
jgi:16S rRNA (adenine1518-N6/adenine1519-N6)-dimethyltransferase